MKVEIEKYDPCSDALEFRKKYSTFEEAWENCPRGDWMLWIAHNVGVNIRKITLAKGYCAKTVIHLMEDKRSINAVKIAIRFGRYKATKKELDAAFSSASYTAHAAYAAAISYTASAKVKDKKETADICRKYLTKDVLRLINKND